MSPPDPPVHPIRFELHRFEDSAHELVPIIGSTSLVDLVKQFEEGAGVDPPGGYAGLVRDNYRFGDLGLYLAGQQQPWPGARVPLLGCECGEWGCWPLLATVTIADGIAEWSDSASLIDLNATTRGSAPCDLLRRTTAPLSPQSHRCPETTDPPVRSRRPTQKSGATGQASRFAANEAVLPHESRVRVVTGWIAAPDAMRSPRSRCRFEASPRGR